MALMKVLLEFPIEVNIDELDGVTEYSLKHWLENEFQYYEEGRHPFGVELLRHGLFLCLKNATQNNIEQIQNKKHQGKFIETLNSSVSIGYLEANELFKSIEIGVGAFIEVK